MQMLSKALIAAAVPVLVAVAPAGTAGGAVAHASAGPRVNTSYIIFNTIPPPPHQQRVACHFNTTHSVDDGGINIEQVRNNCSARMWLHQNLNGSGQGFCVSPKTHRPPPGGFNRWRQVQVSSNKHRCT